MVRARKRFGQNFLKDEAIIDAIIELIQPKACEHFVEIGPGLGAITSVLLPKVASLHAIEIDRDLIEKLKIKFSDKPHFHLYENDALKQDFGIFPAPFRLVGNLPYNISTPLIFHLLQFSEAITDITVMLQKEVVDRLRAEPSTKDYGRLTVMMQYHCRVGASLPVPPESFTPRPKVDSAVVRLFPHDTPPVQAQDYRRFSEIVTAAFSKRRKQLKNSLSNYITEEGLISLNITPTKRPEDVSLDEYVTISNKV